MMIELIPNLSQPEFSLTLRAERDLKLYQAGLLAIGFLR
jgi:hypothetical protein